jgi:hypothetical protein
MEPMGERKPCQLLDAMLEFCPARMKKHLSFHYFFMQRLTRALRTQLGEVQPGDPRALAAMPTSCGLFTHIYGAKNHWTLGALGEGCFSFYVRKCAYVL